MLAALLAHAHALSSRLAALLEAAGDEHLGSIIVQLERYAIGTVFAERTVLASREPGVCADAVAGLAEHVFDHDAEVGVEVVGYVDGMVEAVDYLALDVDDFYGAIRLLDGARAVPVVGDDRAVGENLDDLCAAAVELADLAELVLADVQVEDADRAVLVAQLAQVSDAVVDDQLAVDVLLRHHVAAHLAAHGAVVGHVHRH